MSLTRLERRTRIKLRIRKIVSGTPSVPRLSVFRSNKEFYAQIIDDASGKTLAAVSSLKDAEIQNVDKKAQAAIVGKKMAEKAIGAGIAAGNARKDNRQIRPGAVADPDLLAIDHPVTAFLFGSRRNVPCIGTGVWFGQAIAAEPLTATQLG